MISTIFVVTAVLVLQMCLIWFLYRIFHNPSIVDTSWSLGLLISGCIYLFSTGISFRKMIILLLLSLWALRLATYLWLTRLRLGHIDKRYLKISESWKINHSLGFFLNFQLQALFILIIATGIYFPIASIPAAQFSHLDLLAMAISLTGILGESLADWQLQQFKKTNPGKVCNVGLWEFSRHPNYFFDWLTWIGFMVFALPAHNWYLGFGSIIMLYSIFNFISGPITERESIRSRGQAYLAYQEKTARFFPWCSVKRSSR